MHFPAETSLRLRWGLQQHLKDHSIVHPGSPRTNPIPILCSFILARTCVLVKSWAPIWGSENMASVTIAQLYYD